MGAPLFTEFVVTTAVNAAALVGGVVRVTVNAFVVAAVMVPTAPRLKVTALLAMVVSKPLPLMMSSVVDAPRSAALIVTIGANAPTCIAVPLVRPFVVTIAFMLPAAVGGDESVTIKLDSVAVETVPTAPLSNAMVLLAAVVSKPRPLIVSVVVSTPKR